MNMQSLICPAVTSAELSLTDVYLQEDSDPQVHESLSIENTLWASTVVASGE